jgi:hypothetical protein
VAFNWAGLLTGVGRESNHLAGCAEVIVIVDIFECLRASAVLNTLIDLCISIYDALSQGSLACMD